MVRISPYPWNLLETVSRRTSRLASEARRRFEARVDPSRLRPAIEAVLSCDATLVVHRVGVGPPPRAKSSVVLATSDPTTKIVLSVEPELAVFALARALGRVPQLGPLGAPLDPPLSGALSAIVVEIARRTFAFPVTLASAPNDDAEGVVVDLTLIADGRSFGASAWTSLAELPQVHENSSGILEGLGALEITLPVVVGVATSARDELASLRPGDAWLAGAGFFIDVHGVGRGVLAPAGAEHGLGIDFLGDGRIMLRGGTVAIAADTETGMAEADEANRLEQTVLEAPVVVRVEIGAVAMSARDWARLRPGDVIETGRRIAEPVVLRVAGREVARGELVNVEGELGVRIREIVHAGEE